MMKLTPETITPCIQICNEEFWIYYVLRDLCKVFPRVIVLDTGSIDATKDIVRSVGDFVNQVTLIEEDYGNDAKKIGNGRNVLRELCPTYWMFIVDGDEIWRIDKLEKIFDHEVPDDTGVIMLGLANIEDIDGQLKKRTHDYQNRDGLFCPEINWKRLDYPFESYGLNGDFPMSRVHYINAHEVYGWHMRHTQRSSHDTFFRREKYNYFKYSGPWEDLPEGWLGGINTKIPNPYLNPVKGG